MQDAEKPDDLVSALADGQLRGHEFARTVERVRADEAARLTWHAYHLVGDVLRAGESMVGQSEMAFAQRVRLRLAQEPARVPGPEVSDLSGIRARLPAAAGSGPAEAEAANDRRFRWKVWAGVASLAMVAVLGWQASVDTGGAEKMARSASQPGTAQLASQQSPSVVAGEPQIMIRDAQLDALLAAHRQTGGHSALEMSAGFLRNATFEGAAR